MSKYIFFFITLIHLNFGQFSNASSSLSGVIDGTYSGFIDNYYNVIVLDADKIYFRPGDKIRVVMVSENVTTKGHSVFRAGSFVQFQNEFLVKLNQSEASFIVGQVKGNYRNARKIEVFYYNGDVRGFSVLKPEL
jgi:hypothetical protein